MAATVFADTAMFIFEVNDEASIVLDSREYRFAAIRAAIEAMEARGYRLVGGLWEQVEDEDAFAAQKNVINNMRSVEAGDTEPRSSVEVARQVIRDHLTGVEEASSGRLYAAFRVLEINGERV